MPNNTAKFIQNAQQIVSQSGFLARFSPFDRGVQITTLEKNKNMNADLDHLLIELTDIADQAGINLRLMLKTNDLNFKQQFQRFGFHVVKDTAHLEMEREPDNSITFQDMDLAESAPPGVKAERFIKHHKKDFRRRYGKRWKNVLYATAWKQFGEAQSFRDSLKIVECLNED